MSSHAEMPLGRPATLIVPLPPGGATDSIARVLAARIQTATGQVVVVENRSGGSGQAAVRAFRQAAPDGNTLLIVPFAMAVLVPLTTPSESFAPGRDFAPIGQLAEYSIAFVVGAQVPTQSMQEYVDWVRQHPATASVGVPTTGSLPHLYTLLLGQAGKVDLVVVPYRGTPQLTADLLGGNVSAGFGVLSDFVEHHRSGKLRILAMSAPRRAAIAPDVPTFRQQGFPALEGKGWTALVAPARIPPAVRAWWAKAVLDALHDPFTRQKLVSLGVEPTGSTPQELETIIARDIARWAPVAKAAGLSGEAAAPIAR